jgi:hypothetical protein
MVLSSPIPAAGGTASAVPALPLAAKKVPCRIEEASEGRARK